MEYSTTFRQGYKGMFISKLFILVRALFLNLRQFSEWKYTSTASLFITLQIKQRLMLHEIVGLVLGFDIYYI